MLSSGGGEEEVAAGWGSSWVWGKYQFEKLVLSWKAPLRKRGLALLRYWIWKMNRCGLAKCIYGCYNSKQSCAFLQQSVLHEVKTNAEALKGGCRGTICNQVPRRICTPRLPLVNFQKCAELSHPPRAEIPATVMRGQEICWTFVGEVAWLCCATSTLFVFVPGGSTWITNMFLFIYIQQQNLLRFVFLSFWLRQGCKCLFSFFTCVYSVLPCLLAEDVPDADQDNDKLTKSPPPPPPRRSYLPGSGLTTTRSGEVIYAARKEAAAVKVWWFTLGNHIVDEWLARRHIPRLGLCL